VSAKKPTTHVLIEKELVIALRERSSVWQCRYCVDGKWQRQSTHTYDVKEAEKVARTLLMEAQMRKKLNVVPITRKFKDVAKSALKRLKTAASDGSSKAIYKDYIKVIDNYLIPILGSYNVDSIDGAVLDMLSEKRVQKMKKTPTKSTMMTHNAALNRVFDEAVYRGYMLESMRPKLTIKAKKTERRAEFSLKEVQVIRASFEKWIELARADAKPIRELLRDYVDVLLSTGARPGRELLDMKWTQLEIVTTANVVDANRKDKMGDDDPLVQVDRSVILKILTGKTGARSAVGNVLTVRALSRIAQRNYDMTLSDLIKSGSKDYIFRFKEYQSKKRNNLDGEVKWLAPTSFVKLLNTFLKEHNLLMDAVTNQKRTFYCFRHSYATFALTNDKVEIHTLAKQMGTSVGMIEKHYSHLDAVKAIHQLRGNETRQLMEARINIDKQYEYKDSKAEKKRKAK